MLLVSVITVIAAPIVVPVAIAAAPFMTIMEWFIGE